MDSNFDQNIRGSDDIVYNGIVAVHKVSNNTIDQYKFKYPSIQHPQNHYKSWQLLKKIFFLLVDFKYILLSIIFLTNLFSYYLPD